MIMMVITMPLFTAAADSAVKLRLPTTHAITD